MRKNLAKHTAKKLPLAKRVLALCFALIFVCSCLLPAFANGTGVELDTPDTEVVEAADPGTEPEPMDLYDEPAAMDDDFAVADEPAAMDDDFAVADEPAAMDDDFAMDDEPAAMDDEVENPVVDDEPAAQDDQVEKPVVDDEPAAMDDQVEKPVEGGEPPVADDTPAKEGATKTTTDASGNTVYEYDTSDTTFPDDDAAALPDGDQMQVDAAFSIPTNIYHFWLKKMSSYDLADIADAAKTAEMTVEQYLAMYGTEKGCYHIMTAADGANLKDYQFANPTSNDDPEGNSRTFAGWYYTDDLGDEQKFVFDEHLYVSEGTTVEVYAKWTDEENLDSEQKQEEAGKTEEKQENKEEKYQQMLIKLISCESMEEQVMLWADYCDMDDFDAFYEYAESLDGAVKEAFENLIISITDFQESGIALLELDTGVHDRTLTVGEKITIKCKNSQNHSNYTWIARDEDGNPTDLVTIVTKSDGSAAITAEKAGTVTIYHYGTYWSWNKQYDDYSEWKTFTINANSYDNASAKIFYLNSPTEDPNRNDNFVWLPSGGQSDWVGKVNTTGATWETGPEHIKSSNNRWTITYHINKNIYLNRLSESEVKNYVKEWPDGTTDATWTLKRSDGPNSRFFTVLNAIWNSKTGYKAKLATDLGIEESQLSKDAIQEIILVPYKISNNSDGYHIDCNITIKSSQSFTAVFLVQQPGVSTYERVFAKNYPLDANGTAVNPIAIVTKDDIKNYKFTQTYNQEIDETKEVNGVRYKFVGWYPENENGEPYGNTLIDTWPYDPSIAELSDGTVNFYAKYVRDSSEAYVTKIVNGLFGDKEKEFHFTWDVNGEPGTNFDLADNQTTNDSIGMRLAVNDVLTLTETNAAGYTTKAIITDALGNQLSGIAEIQATGEKEDDRKRITVTITEEMLKSGDGKFRITVINERDATVDNGVLLDTLPYILILVVVAGGGVLLFLRKRKNDDDE